MRSWEGQGYLRSHVGAVYICLARSKSQESEIHGSIHPLVIHEPGLQHEACWCCGVVR